MSSRPQRSELDPRPARHPIVTPAQNRVPLTPSHVKSPALSFPVGQITKALASPSLLYKYLPPPHLLFFLHPLEPSLSPCAASIFLGHLHPPGTPPSLEPSPSPSAISAPLSYPKDSPILIFLSFPLPIRIVPGSSIRRSPMALLGAPHLYCTTRWGLRQCCLQVPGLPNF